MLSAEGEAPPPAELLLAWECQRYHTLPEAGGYFDQPAQTIRLMTVLSNVYNFKSRIRNMVGEQIHQLSTEERRIGEYLKQEGLL